jgi:hypothetical protein
VKQVFGIPGRKSTKCLISAGLLHRDHSRASRSERGVYGGSGRAVDR